MLKQTKASDIKREWHLVDAKDKILGRLTTAIALLLMGKNKPYFVRHLDCGDYVVVVNAKEIKVTGKKETQKEYDRYSGYPGGRKVKSLRQVRAENPARIISEAVRGMLPNNKLRNQMMARLKVFAGTEHLYEDELKK